MPAGSVFLYMILYFTPFGSFARFGRRLGRCFFGIFSIGVIVSFCDGSRWRLFLHAVFRGI